MSILMQCSRHSPFLPLSTLNLKTLASYGSANGMNLVVNYNDPVNKAANQMLAGILQSIYRMEKGLGSFQGGTRWPCLLNK